MGTRQSQRADQGTGWQFQALLQMVRRIGGIGGAKFEMSCYSPVSKLTTVTSGHVSWNIDQPLTQLRPGDRLRVSGVAINTGTAGRGAHAACSMTWNTYGFTAGGVAAPGASERCAGDLVIPRPGMRPSGELIKEARLIQFLEFGNGTGIQRHLIYRWQVIQGQAANTSAPPATPASFAGNWIYDAPNATVEGTQNGGNARLTITQRRWGVPGPHYEITGTVNGRTLTGNWRNIIHDFSAVHPALVRQFGDPRCTHGGAISVEISGDGSSLRVTSAVDPCNHGWLGLVLNRQ
jgi:hypothetical protein